MHAEFAVFIFLSIGAISLFGIFLPVAAWVSTRQKEREAYYKAETMRRIAESSGDGARAAIEMLQEESRLKQLGRRDALLKQREGLKIGGLVTVGVGIGLGAFLWSVGGGEGSPWLVGLIPFMVGVALLVYVFFMAAPIEPDQKN